MAYSQSKKLTNIEKKLEAVKRQLFGKEESHIKKNVSIPTFTTETTIKHQDLTYFRKDLLKILTLATLAISAQLILYLQFTFRFLTFN